MTVTRVKATVQQNLDLSKKYWAKGVTPEASLADLKARHYVIDGVEYKASSVAQGISMLIDINKGALDGKVGATKQKGLHLK
jgi:hypothetical protein